jgi:hypothetical protein
LKLPAYYYPSSSGKRKYAGIYVSNVVLEPCGPNTNIFYATKDFRAIIFGLTFESSKLVSQVTNDVAAREIQNKVIGDQFIYISDTILCGDNITISFMDKKDKIHDRKKLDSLRNVLIRKSRNELGIEYVKEIQIGYKNSCDLNKWTELINPSRLNNNGKWGR